MSSHIEVYNVYFQVNSIKCPVLLCVFIWDIWEHICNTGKKMKVKNNWGILYK